MQILHFGRYAYHQDLVAPSALQAPINPMKPKALSTEEVYQTVDDFVRCAALAKVPATTASRSWARKATCSTNSLPHAPTSATTNGVAATATASAFRSRSCAARAKRVGANFIIIYRLSMLDLVEGGSTLDEVIELAQALEAAGATIINTGIGWHEARIPTIATKVPRAAWAWVTRQLKGKVGIPLVATNRINTPEVAEQLLADGYCDMVSMARPFLADPVCATRPRKAAPTRSTPASAATRPAWTTPFAARSPRAWSTRAPAMRR
jgi:2,4-dienoyl-CoA reductase (NADPH2)